MKSRIGKHLLLITILMSYAFSLSIRSQIDKTTTTIGTPVTLKLIATTESKGSFPALNIPQLKDWTINGKSVATNTKIINGKYTSEHTINYSLYPKKAGKLTIPSIHFKINDKPFNTNQFIVTVTKSTATTTTKQLPAIFHTATTNKKEYYTNEPIIYTKKFYTSKNLYSLTGIQNPAFQNIEQYPSLAEEQKRYTERLNNINYQVIEINSALISKSDGQANIGKSKIGFLYNPFTRQKRVESNTTSISIKKRNFPETTPIGSFSIIANISTSNISVNNGIYFDLIIEGNGSLKISSTPKINLPNDIEVYDPEVKLTETIVNRKIVSTKKYTYLIIPRASGKYIIPKIEFSYFSLKSKRLEKVYSKEKRLTVASNGDSNKKRINTFNSDKDTKKDILFVKDIHNNYQIQKLINNYIKLLAISLIVGLIFSILKRILKKESVITKNKLKIIRKKINKEIQNKNTSIEQKIYKTNKLLYSYFHHYFNTKEKTPHPEDIKQLANTKIPTLFNNIESIKYSQNNDNETLLQLIEEILNELNKLKESKL